jgi:glycosyltransferase involved in cell wall biosynthesis
MRVVFDSQIFAVHQYGGIARYFYEVSNRLARSDDIEIFAPLYMSMYFGRHSDIVPRGFKIAQRRRIGRLTKLVNLAASLTYLRHRRDVDIFHETYFTRRDCAPRRAKRIITVYDMVHERCADSFAPDDPTRGDKAHAVRRADHVICISEHTRRDLIEILNVPPDKTSVVYLGHSLSVDAADVQPAAYASPFLLYVGLRSTYKNFEGLLRAFAGSRLVADGLSLVCFGGGPLQPHELATISALGIPPHQVSQVGGDDQVLASYYRAATAFVYPSMYEGFGIPPLEAMASGCPTVCSNTSSIPEVVGDAALLFDPRDPLQIRAAIEDVVYSRELATTLVAAGKLRASQFSWQKCAHDTRDVYCRMLDREA